MKSRPVALLPYLLLLAILTGCSDEQTPLDAAGAEAMTVRNRAIGTFWSAQDSIMNASPSRVFDQASSNFDPRVYPSESAISLLSAYLVTRETRFRDAALRQLQYARSLEDENHLHRYPEDLSGDAPFGLVSTNAQARLVVGYYLAWHVLGEANYLDWADETLAAFLLLPATEACWNEECFTAWSFLYSREEGFEPWTSCFVNPNQNAVIGLAMTLLFHTPESVFHEDEQVGRLARQQLDAAVVMMDTAGRIPLSASGDDVSLYDTRYGHVTLLHVMWAQLLWQDPAMQGKLELAHGWVDEFTRGGARTLRYYPEFVDGPVPDPAELYYRFPLVYFLDGDQAALDSALDEVWLRYRDYVTVQGGWINALAVLDAMGVPRDVYWQ